MSETDTLKQELRSLLEILKSLESQPIEQWSPEWMNMQSLLARQTDLLRWIDLAEGMFEFEMTLTGSEIHNSSVDVAFLGKLLSTLQATVNAVGESIVTGNPTTNRRFKSNILEQANMRLVGTHSGSFVMGMAGPTGRDIQLSFEDNEDNEDNEEDLAVPIFDEAIKKVLDVLDAAENDVDSQNLPTAISDLGGHRPLKRMIDFASVLAASNVDIIAVDRSPFRAYARECRLSASGAHRLQKVLARTHLTTERISMQGRLTGIRWKSGIFDLDTEDRGIVTGKIPIELRREVRDVFDSLVNVVIERTITQTEVEGESKTLYRLVEIG
ncbi:MAG: hypothetical protein HKL84_06095 [Acidimicrobiaceae bacterium]|nr:hypothetical protein [Acidimicrobiaceae bacterium]